MTSAARVVSLMDLEPPQAFWRGAEAIARVFVGERVEAGTEIFVGQSRLFTPETLRCHRASEPLKFERGFESTGERAGLGARTTLDLEQEAQRLAHELAGRNVHPGLQTCSDLCGELGGERDAEGRASAIVFWSHSSPIETATMEHISTASPPGPTASWLAIPRNLLKVLDLTWRIVNVVLPTRSLKSGTARLRT